MIRNKRKFQGRTIYFRYKKFSWNNSFARDKFAFRKHKRKWTFLQTNGLHSTISEFVTGLILLLKTILQQQNQYWSSVNVSRLHDLQWIGSNEMNCDTQKNQEVLLTEEEMK